VEKTGAASAGSGNGGVERGRTRGLVQRGAGAARVLHMAGRAAARRREKQRRKGWRRKKADCFVIFQKYSDLTVMPW
jgi:hypothetical protein